MSKKSDFQLNLDFLDSAIIKTSKPKKKITDNDLKNADLEAIQQHTYVYSDYLETFVDEYKKKSHNQRVMKNWFFVLTLILLFVIIGGGVCALVIVCVKENITSADVATVITAVVGAVSSFLILPKVIAENLFPSKEEDRTAEIFGRMFEHDINIRNFYNASPNGQNPEIKREK